MTSEAALDVYPVSIFLNYAPWIWTRWNQLVNLYHLYVESGDARSEELFETDAKFITALLEDLKPVTPKTWFQFQWLATILERLRAIFGETIVPPDLRSAGITNIRPATGQDLTAHWIKKSLDDYTNVQNDLDMVVIQKRALAAIPAFPESSVPAQRPLTVGEWRLFRKLPATALEARSAFLYAAVRKVNLYDRFACWMALVSVNAVHEAEFLKEFPTRADKRSAQHIHLYDIQNWRGFMNQFVLQDKVVLPRLEAAIDWAGNGAYIAGGYVNPLNAKDVPRAGVSAVELLTIPEYASEAPTLRSLSLDLLPPSAFRIIMDHLFPTLDGITLSGCFVPLTLSQTLARMRSLPGWRTNLVARFPLWLELREDSGGVMQDRRTMDIPLQMFISAATFLTNAEFIELIWDKFLKKKMPEFLQTAQKGDMTVVLELLVMMLLGPLVDGGDPQLLKQSSWYQVTLDRFRMARLFAAVLQTHWESRASPRQQLAAKGGEVKLTFYTQGPDFDLMSADHAPVKLWYFRGDEIKKIFPSAAEFNVNQLVSDCGPRASRRWKNVAPPMLWWLQLFLRRALDAHQQITGSKWDQPSKTQPLEALRSNVLYVAQKSAVWDIVSSLASIANEKQSGQRGSYQGWLTILALRRALAPVLQKLQVEMQLPDPLISNAVFLPTHDLLPDLPLYKDIGDMLTVYAPQEMRLLSADAHKDPTGTGAKLSVELAIRINAYRPKDVSSLDFDLATLLDTLGWSLMPNNYGDLFEVARGCITPVCNFVWETAMQNLEQDDWTRLYRGKTAQPKTIVPASKLEDEKSFAAIERAFVSPQAALFSSSRPMSFESWSKLTLDRAVELEQQAANFVRTFLAVAPMPVSGDNLFLRIPPAVLEYSLRGAFACTSLESLLSALPESKGYLEDTISDELSRQLLYYVTKEQYDAATVTRKVNALFIHSIFRRLRFAIMTGLGYGVLRPKQPPGLRAFLLNIPGAETIDVRSVMYGIQDAENVERKRTAAIDKAARDAADSKREAEAKTQEQAAEAVRRKQAEESAAAALRARILAQEAEQAAEAVRRKQAEESAAAALHAEKARLLAQEAEQAAEAVRRKQAEEAATAALHAERARLLAQEAEQAAEAVRRKQVEESAAAAEKARILAQEAKSVEARKQADEAAVKAAKEAELAQNASKAVERARAEEKRASPPPPPVSQTADVVPTLKNQLLLTWYTQRSDRALPRLQTLQPIGIEYF